PTDVQPCSGPPQPTCTERRARGAHAETITAKVEPGVNRLGHFVDPAGAIHLWGERCGLHLSGRDRGCGAGMILYTLPVAGKNHWQSLQSRQSSTLAILVGGSQDAPVRLASPLPGFAGEGAPPWRSVVLWSVAFGTAPRPVL